MITTGRSMGVKGILALMWAGVNGNIGCIRVIGGLVIIIIIVVTNIMMMSMAKEGSKGQVKE